jgi:hypothetical protein
MSVNLKEIAESRVNDPMNTWPDHTRSHAVTLMGNFLWDFHCLRCWIEEVATDKARKAKDSSNSLPCGLKEIG